VTSILAIVIWAGGALPSLPPTDHIDINATVSAATGVSLAGANGQTFAARSPTLLALEVGFRHPQVPWLEVAVGLLIEAEPQPSVGVDPKLRMFVPVRPVRPYVLIGVPAIIAPRTLLGVQAGVGLEIPLHRRFGVLFEGSASTFFLGDDRMNESVLLKLDAAIGVRTYF